AEVVRTAGVAVRQRLQREQVRACEVAHVNVVADAGAVGGRVVRAEDGHLGNPAGGRLQHDRNQVRLGLVALAAAGRGARGVEISQADRAQAVRRGVPADRVREGEVGLTVSIRRPRRVGLLYRL